MECPKCGFENPDTTRFCGQCGTQLKIETPSTPVSTETYVTPTAVLKVGELFADRYHVIEEVGRGGMGTVYKVLDTEINEKVALKLLKPEISADEKTIERFRNELKVTRKMSNKNICRMYHLGKRQQTRFITMEFIPGEDLKSTLHRVGSLNMEKAIHITKQICDGLVEAHKSGIVHRDLKPQNIMIDKGGNALIMDFGIARSLVSHGITETGVMIGTPEYMSPEQVEGKDIDQRSDIYSLGIILYEMVTGDVPFKGSTPFSIAIKHKSEFPKAPREMNYQIPEALNSVILRCMEKEPEQRYQKVDVFKTELEKIEKELSTKELRESGKKRKEKKTEKKRKEKKRVPLWTAAGVLALIIVIVGGYMLFNLGGGEKKKPEISNNMHSAEKKPEETKSLEVEIPELPAPEKKEVIETKDDSIKTVPEKTALKIEAGPPPEEKTVQPSPSPAFLMGTLELKSQPSGADVFINGQKRGETPFSLNLSPGIHRIKISKPPVYEEVVETLNIKTKETVAKTYDLVPIYILQVTTVPSDADISIDGQPQGKSPAEIKLNRSSCLIHIDNGIGWKQHEESLDLQPGNNPIRFNLKKQTHTMTIRTDPSVARVFIDDGLMGTTPLQADLEHGTHSVRIEKEGYRIHTESINMEADIERTFPLSLLQQVSVRLIVQPYAAVFLNGTSIGVIPPIKTIDIVEGKHTLKFVNDRMNKEFSREFELKPGKSWEIRMNMGTGEFQIKNP